jgi:hypothetical protein
MNEFGLFENLQRQDTKAQRDAKDFFAKLGAFAPWR